jgi:XTP/dITP diphosphohydrolase
MIMNTLLVATTNQGKIKEIKQLLQPYPITVVSVSDRQELQFIEVEETGADFEENALIKARTYGRLSGLVTLADDSGLCIDALDGKPGVLSKRLGESDPERITKVLSLLKDVPLSKRTAHFTTAMVLFNPASEKYFSTLGETSGIITSSPKGDNGFGYDPIFLSPKLNKTFGEASFEEKNTVSHRFQALEKMTPIIIAQLT